MEPILTRGQLVPTFTLPNHDGYAVRRTAYRGKQHLALVFLPLAGAAAQDYLRELAAAYADIRAASGEVLAIMRDRPESLAALKGSLSLPFVLLSDDDGAVTAQFLPEAAGAGVAITDRYGELYYSAAAAAAGGLPPTSEIHSWLEAINHQCSL